MNSAQSAAGNAGKSVTHAGWEVVTHKHAILTSGEIDTMTKKLGIAPPEMIFGNNSVEIKHQATGWGIRFTALDALDLVDKTGESMLKVAYSEAWQKMRQQVHEDIKEIVKPFDWTYTTPYKGTVLDSNTSPQVCVWHYPPMINDIMTDYPARAHSHPLSRGSPGPMI
jgi:type 2A phosphatase activator TIP41